MSNQRRGPGRRGAGTVDPGLGRRPVRHGRWQSPGRIALALAVFVANSGPGSLSGQTGVHIASPLIPPGHWSHAALTRLHGAGLLPESFDPATSTVGRDMALRMFGEATERAREVGPDWAELADGYRERFSEEFPGTAHRSTNGTGIRALYDAGLSVGFEGRRNGLLPRHQSSGSDPLATTPLSDLSDPAAGVELGVHLPSAGPVTFAGRTAIALHGGRVAVSEAYAAMHAGHLGVWAGRRRLGLGVNDGGSVVLHSEVPFDGAGFYLAEGVHLPGLLRHLGYFRLETLFSRMDRSGEVESPWFFGLRTAISPHPRVQIGLNRGALFAGEGDRVPRATVGRVLRMIAGINTATPDAANFEDHVASMDVWFRPPLGQVHLILYGEWGVEDLEAQRREMPAFVTGATLAGVPGATWLGLGFERTSFGAPASGRMGWYEHRVFGTWTAQGRLLAHPLGGEGREIRIYGTADLFQSRLRIDGRMHTRRRTEKNLFSPEREGRSRGMDAELLWRLTPSVEMEGGGALEVGDGWRSSLGFIGMRYLF